jgi:hypothetical protein
MNMRKMRIERGFYFDCIDKAMRRDESDNCDVILAVSTHAEMASGERERPVPMLQSVGRNSQKGLSMTVLSYVYKAGACASGHQSI